MRYIELVRYSSDLNWRGSAPKIEFDFENAGSILSQLYGSFSACVPMDNRVILLSDSIASIPLFYCVSYEEVIVSDAAEAIGEYLSLPMNQASVNELLHSGYVLGSRTLFDKVCSVRPGECVSISLETGEVQKRRWYDLHYDCQNETMEVQTSGFDEVVGEVFSDLNKRLAGRQVIVPLSGGCDSRTVAVWLKQLGYENVICTSYGKANSWESERSRKIASTLGYEWQYVKYDGDVWAALYSSDDYPRFLKYSGRGHTIGCIQALPAIMTLRMRELISRNAVVMPGHALDFSCGSHLPAVGRDEKWSAYTLKRFLSKEHFSLARHGLKLDPIRDIMSGEPLQRSKLVDEIMHWEWENRQSKFIANDVRTYEFLGYSFELPFWDVRICDFLSTLPYAQLYGRRFQYEYMRKYIDPLAGVQEEYPTAIIRPKLKSMAKSAIMSNSVLRELRMLQKQYVDANAFYEHMDKKHWRENIIHYGGGFNMNSVVASDYIGLIRDGMH